MHVYWQQRGLFHFALSLHLWFEALKSGANLRQRLGGRAGLRRPGRLNTQVRATAAVLPRHSKRFQQCRIIQGYPRTPRQCSLSLFNIFARFNPSGVCAWGSLTMIGRRVNFSKTWNKSGIVQVQVKSLNLTEANCELRQKSFFCRRWSW